jgi:hypothetical protein
MVRTKIAALLLIAAIMMGCSAKPRIDVREVYVPTPVEFPSPPTDAWNIPSLPIHNLDADTSPSDTVKAYAATVKILQEWGLKLQIYLEAYKHDEEDSDSNSK